MIRRQVVPVLTAALVLPAGVLAGVVLGAAPVVADEHTKAEAEDFTEEANFTIALPERTDHYPGDHPVHGEQNGYNASIEYNAVGAEAMREVGAEEGAFVDVIILEADFIDYSQCDVVQNTKSFGIDRGNNNSGTRTDEGLTQYRRSSDLGEGRLVVDFYSFEDLSNDPPYVAPGDAIVAAQGAGSNDGPCLKMTSDPGWYQIQGFINGTEADNGPDQEPSEGANRAGIIAYSNYVYICECDSEAEAREQLGPPPSEGGSSDAERSTPTPTRGGGGVTPTSTEPATTPTSTPTVVPRTATPTAVQRTGGRNDADGGVRTTPTRSDARGGARTTSPRGNAGGGEGSVPARNTPTVAEAPGFTPVVALVALLAAALLVCRRGIRR